MRTGAARLAVPALLALLVLGQVHQGRATVGSLWWSVVSWDNPVTHEQESLASQALPSGNPYRQVADLAIPARPRRDRLRLPEPSARARHEARTDDVTRSPPAAA